MGLANKFATVSKVNELITCKLKVQVVVALGLHEVLFALGRHEVFTNDMWCSPPIRKRIWVGRYNKVFWPTILVLVVKQLHHAYDLFISSCKFRCSHQTDMKICILFFVGSVGYCVIKGLFYPAQKMSIISLLIGLSGAKMQIFLTKKSTFEDFQRF